MARLVVLVHVLAAGLLLVGILLSPAPAPRYASGIGTAAAATSEAP